MDGHTEQPKELPFPTPEADPQALKVPLTLKQQRLAATKAEKEQLWNEVGFHRITGGFFYNYILLIVEVS